MFLKPFIFPSSCAPILNSSYIRSYKQISNHCLLLFAIKAWDFLDLIKKHPPLRDVSRSGGCPHSFPKTVFMLIPSPFPSQPSPKFHRQVSIRSLRFSTHPSSQRIPFRSDIPHMVLRNEAVTRRNLRSASLLPPALPCSKNQTLPFSR